jgi:hypothetical protein
VLQHIEETHDNFFLAALEKRQQQQCVLQTQEVELSSAPQHEDDDATTGMDMDMGMHIPSTFREQIYHASGGGGGFRCMEEDCNATFLSMSSRTRHLMEAHQYPKWFRFRYPLLPFPSSAITIVTKSGTKRTDNSRSRKSKNKNNNDLYNHKHADDSIVVNDKKKKQERKRKQKEKRALIPCRFLLAGNNCRHGDKCMFSHDNVDFDVSTAAGGGIAENNDNGSNHHVDMNSMDMDMDALAHEMTIKAKVSAVPDNICFGRRRR